MGNLLSAIILAALVVLSSFYAIAAPQTSASGIQQERWNAAARALHYTPDQGSRLIALSWLRVLKQPNGRSFRADGLIRYGYGAMRPLTDVAHGIPGYGCRSTASGGSDLLRVSYAKDCGFKHPLPY